jgi:hypothetical protein
MGHASERTTHRIYSHMPVTGLTAVVDVMGRLFAGAELQGSIPILTVKHAR